MARRVHLRVVDQRDAALFEIAARLPGNVIERRAESGHQRHRRRVRALALHGVLALLAQVEVVARIFCGLHRRPRLLAHAQIREARRNHDCLLRPADQHVDPPAVHVEVRRAEAGDAIHDKQRVGRHLHGAALLWLPHHGAQRSRSPWPAYTRPCAPASAPLSLAPGRRSARRAPSPRPPGSRMPWSNPSSARQICRPSAPALCRPARSGSTPTLPSRPSLSRPTAERRSWCPQKPSTAPKPSGTGRETPPCGGACRPPPWQTAPPEAAASVRVYKAVSCESCGFFLVSEAKFLSVADLLGSHDHIIHKFVVFVIIICRARRLWGANRSLPSFRHAKWKT